MDDKPEIRMRYYTHLFGNWRWPVRVPHRVMWWLFDAWGGSFSID